VALKLGIGAVGTAVVLGVGASVASGVILGMGYLANRARSWFRRDNAEVSGAPARSQAPSQSGTTTPSTPTKSGWIRGLMKRVSGWWRGEKEPTTTTSLPVLAQAVETDQRHHPLNTPPGSASSSLLNGSQSGERSPAGESDHGSTHTAVTLHPSSRPSSPEIPKPDIAALGEQLKAVEKQLRADFLTAEEIEACCQQVERINKNLKACSLIYHPDKTGGGDYELMQAVNDFRETFREVKSRLEEIKAQEPGKIRKSMSFWEQLNEWQIELNRQGAEIAKMKEERVEDKLEQAAELEKVKLAQAAELEKVKLAQAAELEKTNEAQAAQALQLQALEAMVQELKQGKGNEVKGRADVQATSSSVRAPMVMQAPRSRRNRAEVEVSAIIPIAAGAIEVAEQTEGRRSRRHSMPAASADIEVVERTEGRRSRRHSMS